MFELASGTQLLARTPTTLRALLAGLGPEWTDAAEGPGTWSPTMVVAHLVHAERVNWIPRARWLLDHGAARPFPAFDQAAPLGALDGAPVADLVDTLARLRAESLATLASWALGEADLARVGTHPAFGEVTLGQLLATWVAHDLAHLGQIARVMAKRYRDAVGPWRAYLPIMER